MAFIPLHYTVGGDFQEFSTTQLRYPAYKLLELFAANNTQTGTVNIGGSGTSIGSISDTTRPNAPGTHPVGTNVNSTVTTFRQVLDNVTENLQRPLEFDGNNLRNQADTELNAGIIDTALSMLVDDGLGSYAIQPTAPTGGTWVQIGSFTDTLRSGATVSTSRLWRKTGDTEPAATMPMKARSDGDVQIMTDAEIETLFKRFQNRIVDSGIGQYRVQSSAPTTGTWIKKGDAFVDTRLATAFQSYAGSYSSSFASYVPIYYGGVYYGDATLWYTSYYTGYYSGRTVLASTETGGTFSLWIRSA